MIEETATVIAVDGDQVLVQTQRRSSCQACSVKQGCGTSVLAKVVGTRSSQIRVDNLLGAQVGDQIALGIEETALVKGSFLVYALPLVMMLAFALLAELMTWSLGWNAELPVILAAATGFSLSVILIRLGLSRTALKQQIQPHMLRILSHGSSTRDIMLAP
jgi:sigma-E factor negative regulatory protein RseC